MRRRRRIDTNYDRESGADVWNCSICLHRSRQSVFIWVCVSVCERGGGSGPADTLQLLVLCLSSQLDDDIDWLVGAGRQTGGAAGSQWLESMAKVKLSNVMGMRAVHVLCSRGVVCVCFLYDRDTGTMIFLLWKLLTSWDNFLLVRTNEKGGIKMTLGRYSYFFNRAKQRQGTAILVRV